MVEWHSGHRTEDPGFESRRGVRFLDIFTFQCCTLYACVLEKNKCFKLKDRIPTIYSYKVLYVCISHSCTVLCNFSKQI
jgi:hypothetical protein